MRKIKFEVWDKEWKKFFTIQEAYSEWEGADRDSKTFGFFIEELFNLNIDRYIPVQFTGLRDNNGGEIYEGDIATHKECNDKILIGRIYDRWGQTVYYRGERNYISNFNWRELEIIGNIYENPELLGVKKC